MMKRAVLGILSGALLLPALSGRALGQLAAPAVGRTWSPVEIAPMPMNTTIAWMAAVQGPLSGMDLSSALPGIQDCLARLARLDLTDPDHAAALSPLLSALSETAGPREFASWGTEKKEKAIQQAVVDAAAKVQLSAAALALSANPEDVPLRDAADIVHKVRSLRKYSMYLTGSQRERIRRLGDGAQDAVRRARKEKTLALAYRGAGAVQKGGTLSTRADGEEVVRTMTTPDGKRARFVRRGSEYLVLVEGEAEARVRYDIANLESAEDVAYPVRRGGRRGVVVDGKVWWAD